MTTGTIPGGERVPCCVLRASLLPFGKIALFLQISLTLNINLLFWQISLTLNINLLFRRFP